MVALDLIAGAPQEVDAMVLLATSPAFGRSDGAWQQEYLAQRLSPLDAGRGMAKLAPGLVKGMASANAAHDVVARAALLMCAVPEATYRSALHAIVAENQLLWSADDRIIFPWERDGWSHLYSVATSGGSPILYQHLFFALLLMNWFHRY